MKIKWLYSQLIISKYAVQHVLRSRYDKVLMNCIEFQRTT